MRRRLPSLLGARPKRQGGNSGRDDSAWRAGGRGHHATGREGALFLQSRLELFNGVVSEGKGAWRACIHLCGDGTVELRWGRCGSVLVLLRVPFGGYPRASINGGVDEMEASSGSDIPFRLWSSSRSDVW